MAVQFSVLSWIFIICFTYLGSVHGDREYTQHVQGDFRDPRIGQHEHFGADHDHNYEFDHEAILGSNAANAEFARLPPHEAKKRLHELLFKMDLNRDERISKGELTTWILNNFRQQEEMYAKSKLMDVDADLDGRVTWGEYARKIYGYSLEELKGFEKDAEKPEMKSFLVMVNDDKSKFKLADQDKDGFLNVLEYAAFLYPHSHPHMHIHEVQRVLRDLDKDNDTFLTFDEYMGPSKPGDEQLLVDKENFKSHDTNNDGKLDMKEIKKWVMPDSKSLATDEAMHLISETDQDKDGILTSAEILDRHDLWVGSAATHYGDNLMHRDEL